MCLRYSEVFNAMSFPLDFNRRPGILVLINDADWELMVGVLTECVLGVKD